MSVFLFDNPRKNRVMVHLPECYCCNYGKGRSGASVGPADQFSGPYSLAEAEQRASALKRGKVLYCSICKPGAAS